MIQDLNLVYIQHNSISATNKVNIVDKKSSSDSLSLNPDTLVPIPTILGSASMKKLSNLSRRKMGTSATSPKIKVS